jgi:cell division protein FtsB
MQKFKKYFFKYARNFYLVVGGTAIVWMCFFDRYNLLDVLQTQSRIGHLEKDLDFYQTEKQRIEDVRSVLENSDAELEKYAREEFRMKRKNEDLYILTDN